LAGATPLPGRAASYEGLCRVDPSEPEGDPITVQSFGTPTASETSTATASVDASRNYWQPEGSSADGRMSRNVPFVIEAKAVQLSCPSAAWCAAVVLHTTSIISDTVAIAVQHRTASSQPSPTGGQADTPSTSTAISMSGVLRAPCGVDGATTPPQPTSTAKNPMTGSASATRFTAAFRTCHRLYGARDAASSNPQIRTRMPPVAGQTRRNFRKGD
jgi:hypothetical protein